MTAYTIPTPPGDTGDSLRWDRLARVLRLCHTYLGKDPAVTDNGTTLTVTFTPDLTAGEQQTLTAIVRISGIGIVSPQELVSVAGDVSTLTTYLGLSSPTNAQSAAAIKSLIRVLGVLVKS